jgi:hypothetical protein
MLELLRSCVVVVNPTFNPDGHERFAVYHNSIGTFDPNPDAIEHDQPWAMYGRFNHYRFDMNRDHLVVSQPEVRQEVAEYLRWNPQVYVDQHGEVDQYFFPPVALPINENLDVALQQRWLDIFGRGNAAAFDRHGWDYFTRKTFDFLYPGYTDTWSALNGAIGMTYETDGGGNLGFAWQRNDGTVVTLRDGVAHHLVAALATIETAANNREAKLKDYLAYRRAALDEGRNGKMKRVVFLGGRDRERAARLAATLRRMGVEVGVATAPFSSTAAHDYADGAGSKAQSRRFDSGAYVVDLSQPQGRLARAILEAEATLNPEFVAAELAKRERNDRRGKNTPQEYPGFYDITAWSLPIAFGVEAYWLGDAPAVSVQQLGAPEEVPGNMRPPFAPEGRVVGGRGVQGYVFPYESSASARLALSLMREGYRLLATPTELKAGGKLFPRGSIVLRTQRNPESLASRIAVLARETGVEVTAVDSQYADESTTGLGSEELRPLEMPRVLVAAGTGVAQTSFGAIWYMLEREIGYRFTTMEVETIAGTDLSKFNVIVLPDGSPSAYSRRFGKGGLDRLKAWVRDGGTLVSLGGASAFVADKETGLTTARAVGAEEEDEKKPAETPKEPAEKKEQATGEAPKEDLDAEPVPPTPLYVPGAIFRAAVDKNYFMSYGYDRDHMPVPVNTDLFLRPSEEGANVVTFPRDLVRLSGFVWPRNTLQLLRGTAYVVEEPTGSGHVVLFAEDVLFRRIWHGLDVLFLNTLVFAPGH